MASSTRVLIVDDNAEDVFMLHRALKKCGFESVSSVSSGEEAAKFVAGLAPYQYEIKPDIIFTDLNMKEIDGLELIHWLKRNPLYRSIPVVLLSGSSDPKIKAALGEDGMISIYQKPHQFSELIDLVCFVIAKHFPESSGGLQHQGS